METFAPGDRVVAINTDLSAPICRMESLPDAYSFPDGPLNEKTVYHVEKVRSAADGHQGLFITGIRVFVGKHHVPWDSSRFRKVDFLKGHVPKKRRRKVPEAQGHPPHLRVLEGSRSIPGNGRMKSDCSSPITIMDLTFGGNHHLRVIHPFRYVWQWKINRKPHRNSRTQYFLNPASNSMVTPQIPVSLTNHE